MIPSNGSSYTNAPPSPRDSSNFDSRFRFVPIDQLPRPEPYVKPKPSEFPSLNQQTSSRPAPPPPG